MKFGIGKEAKAKRFQDVTEIVVLSENSEDLIRAAVTFLRSGGWKLFSPVKIELVDNHSRCRSWQPEEGEARELL